MTGILTDGLVYGLLVVIFQFIASPILSRMTYNQILLKNKKWVEENPSFKKKNPWPKLLLSKIVGMFLITALVYAVAIENQKIVDIILLFTALFFVFQHLVIDSIRYQKIIKRIPKEEERTAQIVPRTVDSYISRCWTYILVTLVGISIIAWIYWALITHEEIGAIALNGAILLSLYGTGIATITFGIKRKPQKGSIASIACFRRLEVAIGSIILWPSVCYYLITLTGKIFQIEILIGASMWEKYLFISFPIVCCLLLVISRPLRKR